jgi:uncharacterized coiled-coil DUF342 family protein
MTLDLEHLRKLVAGAIVAHIAEVERLRATEAVAGAIVAHNGDPLARAEAAEKERVALNRQVEQFVTTANDVAMRVGALIRERDELRERLRAADAFALEQEKEMDSLEAERDALKAEVERLRKWLEQIESTVFDGAVLADVRVQAAVRAALAGEAAP